MSTELICNKFEKIGSKLLDRKIDLILGDPPDNEGRTYDNYSDKLDYNSYNSLLIQWINKACSICDGPVFFSIAERWMPTIETMIHAGDAKLIRRIIWHYTFGQNNKYSYSPCFRPIYWLNNDTIYPENIKIPSARQEKYGDKRAKSGGKMPENVWDFPRICGTFKERRKWHPTQFPEALVKRIILGHTKPGDMVLDPFSGSGTTAIVCAETDRNFIGIDQSDCYLKQTKKELEKRYEHIKVTRI